MMMMMMMMMTTPMISSTTMMNINIILKNSPICLGAFGAICAGTCGESPCEAGGEEDGRIEGAMNGTMRTTTVMIIVVWTHH
jgi:hypothetical protein